VEFLWLSNADDILYWTIQKQTEILDSAKYNPYQTDAETATVLAYS